MRRVDILTCVAVVLVWTAASVVPCRAQTGNELLHKCTDALRSIDRSVQSTSGYETANREWCTGYIKGLVDGYQDATVDVNMGLGVQIPSPLCLPWHQIIVEQLIRIVVKYLREYPQDLHLPSGMLAAAAVRDAFPCPASGAPMLEHYPRSSQSKAPKSRQR
jgi:hypothetical protein